MILFIAINYLHSLVIALLTNDSILHHLFILSDKFKKFKKNSEEIV
jgi:hypothetical protein